MSGVVLDASAVLALLLEEPGSEIVRANLPGAVLSTVNLAEVVTKMLEWGDLESDIHSDVAALQLVLISFDAPLAYRAARLRSSTRHLGLSFGDRACLALAASRQLPVLTTDRNWARLRLGIDIRLVRGTA